MTDVQKIGDKSTYIDSNLRANLDDMMAAIKKDDDVVILIDGRERVGKSVIAQTIGWYMAGGDLHLSSITLTPPEFKNKVLKSDKYHVIIFDECYLGLSSEETMHSYNRLLKKMLVTVGQKNLVLILVLPSVFDIAKYVALHRADCLIHCFKHKGQRGHFAFYNAQRLKSLYIAGKKFYSYWRPKPNFHGRFTNFYAVDEQEYRAKKLKSLNDFMETAESKGEELNKRSKLLYKSLAKIRELMNATSHEQVAKEMGCSPMTVSRACKWVQSHPSANTNP